MMGEAGDGDAPSRVEPAHPAPGNDAMPDSPEPLRAPPDDPATSPGPTPETRRTGLPKRLRGTREVQDETAPGAAAHASPERVERARALAIACARIAEDNRGRDIVVLDLRGATPLVDTFVIATAASRRQANAIAIEVDREMKKRGEQKLGLEGSEEARWILIDYGDFVVHVFSEEARAYYALDEVWGDVPRIEWADPTRPRPKPTPEIIDDPELDEEEE
jgi:ribosome-associated protein